MHVEVYDPVMWRLLTFPLLTVAAINGHGTYWNLQWFARIPIY